MLHTYELFKNHPECKHGGFDGAAQKKNDATTRLPHINRFILVDFGQAAKQPSPVGSVSGKQPSPAPAVKFLPLKCCLAMSGWVRGYCWWFRNPANTVEVDTSPQVVYPIIYRVVVKIPGDAEVSSIKSMLVFNQKKHLSLLVLCCRCFLLAPDNDSRLPVTFSCFGVEKCHFYCSPGAWSSGMELNTGFVSRNACVGNVVFRF